MYKLLLAPLPVYLSFVEFESSLRMLGFWLVMQDGYDFNFVVLCWFSVMNFGQMYRMPSIVD